MWGKFRITLCSQNHGRRNVLVSKYTLSHISTLTTLKMSKIHPILTKSPSNINNNELTDDGVKKATKTPKCIVMLSTVQPLSHRRSVVSLK